MKAGVCYEWMLHPPSARLLATSPVATGEAKIEGPRQGDGNPCLAAFSARLVASFKNQNPARGRSVHPASPIEMGIMNT